MPKSKHRRKKGAGRALSPAQRQSRARKTTKADIVAGALVLLFEKCRKLFGEEPPDGYSDEQIDEATRHLQDEGIFPPT